MDDHDLQDEYAREDEDARRQTYGNVEARQIVDALASRWEEFTSLPREQYLGEVYDAVLTRVDARLADGTPAAQVPALAEGWFRDEVRHL